MSYSTVHLFEKTIQHSLITDNNLKKCWHIFQLCQVDKQITRDLLCSNNV